MEPKDIENPEAELDFRHQLRAEKEVIKISSNLPVIFSLPHQEELDYMWQCHCCGDINYTKKCSCGNGI